MTTLREAAQAALEALTAAVSCAEAYEAGAEKYPVTFKQWTDMQRTAADAIRAALAAEPDANERGNTLTPARIERIMALADEMVAAAARDGYMPGGFDAARAALLAELEGKT